MILVSMASFIDTFGLRDEISYRGPPVHGGDDRAADDDVIRPACERVGDRCYTLLVINCSRCRPDAGRDDRKIRPCYSGPDRFGLMRRCDHAVEAAPGG